MPRIREVKQNGLVSNARREAAKIESKFRKKHGMSSIEHLKQVMEFRNQAYDDCNCFACCKARYVPLKIKTYCYMGEN